MFGDWPGGALLLQHDSSQRRTFAVGAPIARVLDVRYRQFGITQLAAQGIEHRCSGALNATGHRFQHGDPMMSSRVIRLGVNIDHVATVRNARGGRYPSPLRAARLAEKAGADGITAHLREDRRHISDSDVSALMNHLSVPLNLEIAMTPEMQRIAVHHAPHAVCIVPERREERTTEAGLDVLNHEAALRVFIPPLLEAGCRVSLFVGADPEQIDAAVRVGAAVVELHTGSYCDAWHDGRQADCRAELVRLTRAAAHAEAVGLEVHAGHGLTYETVQPIAQLPQIAELNIGHFLVGESIFVGFAAAIRRMNELIEDTTTVVEDA